MLLNIGHWGHTNSRLFPDNCLEAFIFAREKNLDGIELDIYLTKDWIPVIIHENGNEIGQVKVFDIQNNQDKLVFIYDLNFNELVQYRLENKISTIPSLQQVLNLFKDKKSWVFLDFKDNSDECYWIVLQNLKELNSQSQYVISSFDHFHSDRVLRILKETHMDHIPFSFLVCPQTDLQSLDFYHKRFRKEAKVIIDVEFILDDSLWESYQKIRDYFLDKYELIFYSTKERECLEGDDLYWVMIAHKAKAFINNYPDRLQEFNWKSA